MSTAREGTLPHRTDNPHLARHPLARALRWGARRLADGLVILLAVAICDPELAAVVGMIALLFGAIVALMRLGLI